MIIDPHVIANEKENLHLIFIIDTTTMFYQIFTCIQKVALNSKKKCYFKTTTYFQSQLKFYLKSILAGQKRAFFVTETYNLPVL